MRGLGQVKFLKYVVDERRGQTPEGGTNSLAAVGFLAAVAAAASLVPIGRPELTR